MNCPHCQAVLTEEVRSCPECQFNYERLGGVFGQMPTLKGVLSDIPRVLSMREAAKVRGAIKQFARQFPQLDFNVLLTAVPSAEPLAKYAFWVFNGAGLCSRLHKGGLNFHLLLVIDTEHDRANLSVGYGLEPFVSEEDLVSVLAVASEQLGEKAFGEAILGILAKATEILHTRAEAVPQVYGLRRKRRSTEH
jgi:uncharacterized membrane protein YgcG